AGGGADQGAGRRAELQRLGADDVAVGVRDGLRPLVGVGGLGEVHRHAVRGAQRVEDLDGGGDGVTGHSIVGQVAAEGDIGGGDRRVGTAGADRDVGDRAGGVDVALVVGDPALDDATVGGGQVALGVEGEGTGAGERQLLPAADREEALALDRQV